MIVALVATATAAYIAVALLIIRYRWIKAETARRKGEPDGMFHTKFCDRVGWMMPGKGKHRNRCSCFVTYWIALAWVLALPAWGVRSFIHPEVKVADPAVISELERL